jgi:hypothetical protein
MFAWLICAFYPAEGPKASNGHKRLKKLVLDDLSRFEPGGEHFLAILIKECEWRFKYRPA